MTRRKTATAGGRPGSIAAGFAAARSVRARAGKPAAFMIEVFSLMDCYTQPERAQLQACLKSEIERKLTLS
jgi:hypothetical protein